MSAQVRPPLLSLGMPSAKVVSHRPGYFGCAATGGLRVDDHRPPNELSTQTLWNGYTSPVAVPKATVRRIARTSRDSARIAVRFRVKKIGSALVAEGQRTSNPATSATRYNPLPVTSRKTWKTLPGFGGRLVANCRENAERNAESS